MTPRIYTYAFHPDYYARRSGMHRLGDYVGSVHVEYDLRWKRLQERSWTLGNWARQLGVWRSGSAWNATWPVLDEWRFARRIRRDGPAIAHFIYGEYTVPKLRGLFHRRGARVVATYHASARRQPQVLGRVRSFAAADWITLVSQTQRAFFEERGFPSHRLRVILHGVDTDFFHPAPDRRARTEGPLRGLLVGATERDHGFMAEVLKKLPAGLLDLEVSTSTEQQQNYRDAPNCRVLNKLSDDELLDAYQQADLLVMPVLDCTANNAFLESMACGTPILTNRIGGVPEYVPADSSFILEEKRVEAWVETLRQLAGDRQMLWRRRPAVRAWVEQFSWPRVARQFLDLYKEMADAED